MAVTENTYSFDKDVTVTDEYGVVINGGDVFSSIEGNGKLRTSSIRWILSYLVM